MQTIRRILSLTIRLHDTGAFTWRSAVRTAWAVETSVIRWH